MLILNKSAQYNINLILLETKSAISHVTRNTVYNNQFVKRMHVDTNSLY